MNCTFGALISLTEVRYLLNFSKKDHYISAVIVAAGSGTRMKIPQRKQLVEINDMPVIAHTLKAFENTNIIDEIVIVTKQEDILVMMDIAKQFGISKVTEIVPGGATRTDSVKNGINAAKGDFVAIHDGVRPCIQPIHIAKTVEAAIQTGAAALGCPVTDTLKKVDEKGIITQTVNRDGMWAIQTPQVFDKELLLKAYTEGDTEGATDDCMLAESIGVKVTMVEGVRTNIKVTMQEDIDIVSSILS